jgi:hypothetical protein
MTNVVGATYATNAYQAHYAYGPQNQPMAYGAYSAGDRMQASNVATTPPRKTLEQQLAEVGEVREGSSFLAKAWNWMNRPDVEAAREFGSAALSSAPSLIMEYSKQAKAASDIASVAAATGANGVAVTANLGKAAQAAGSSGIMAVLAKVGAVTGTIGGVIQLLRDSVQCKTNPSKLEKGMLLSGGYLAATGSAIALCGGLFPGAVIGLIGTLIHASGLVVKSIRLKKEAAAVPPMPGGVPGHI